MADVTDLVRAVHAAPPGERTWAFFDDRGTILDDSAAPLSLGECAGRTVAEAVEAGDRLLKAKTGAALHPEVWELIQAHRACGHRVVVVSRDARFQVEPIARAVDADDVLCTPAELDEGVITGRLAGTALWGAARAEAVRAVARERGIDLADAFAYADHSDDLTLLAAVGHPVAVGPDRALRAAAAEREWPVLEVRPRTRIPGLRSLTRTAGFYGGMAAGAGVGAGVGLAKLSGTTGAEYGLRVASDLGLALSGSPCGWSRARST